MLESMLGPETMKKMMATLTGLVFAILAFIGMILIMIASVNPIFHAHFWPALVIVGCAGGWLMVKGKCLKIGLSGIAMLVSLWVLINTICGFAAPPGAGLGALISGAAGLPEFIQPILLMFAGTGALLAVFGSVVGIWGAMRYVEGKSKEAPE